MSVLGPISILQSTLSSAGHMGSVSGNSAGDILWIADEDADGKLEISASGDLVAQFNDEQVQSMQINVAGDLSATYITEQ